MKDLVVRPVQLEIRGRLVKMARTRPGQWEKLAVLD